LTTAMIASEMPAAIRPYSMAVRRLILHETRNRFFICNSMCTRAGRLTFGLAGVLSTVTIGSPYARRIARQLIR
jgi:hypothetical protein